MVRLTSVCRRTCDLSATCLSCAVKRKGSPLVGCGESVATVFFPATSCSNSESSTSAFCRGTACDASITAALCRKAVLAARCLLGGPLEPLILSLGMARRSTVQKTRGEGSCYIQPGRAVMTVISQQILPCVTRGCQKCGLSRNGRRERKERRCGSFLPAANCGCQDPCLPSTAPSLFQLASITTTPFHLIDISAVATSSSSLSPSLITDSRIPLISVSGRLLDAATASFSASHLTPRQLTPHTPIHHVWRGRPHRLLRRGAPAHRRRCRRYRRSCCLERRG